MSGLISTPDKKTDTIIEGEVSEWRRRRQRRNTVTTEDEAEFSEACRGLVSPHVCSKIIKDITQETGSWTDIICFPYLSTFPPYTMK